MAPPPGVIAMMQRKRTQEEIVHVPKIIPIYKQDVEVPIPMTQEEVVHVPKIIPPIYKQVVKEPNPMTQEEIAHMPKVRKLHRIYTEEVKKAAEASAAADEAAKKAEEEIVEVPIPMTQEEIVHMPNIKYPEYMDIIRMEQEEIAMKGEEEMIVEMPIPMTQEEIVEVHWTLAPAGIDDEFFHSVVEGPVPMIQEELIDSFTLGPPLPMAPKGRAFPLHFKGFSAKVVFAQVHQSTALSNN